MRFATSNEYRRVQNLLHDKTYAFEQMLKSVADAVAALPEAQQKQMTDACRAHDGRCWCGMHKGTEFDK